MRRPIRNIFLIVLVSTTTYLIWLVRPETANDTASRREQLVVTGKQLYLNGTMLDGTAATGRTQGDVLLTGTQVSCVNCHRNSAMGSNEGDEVVPPLRGNILFEALRLPTSKPPLAPEIRPAYDSDSLRRALRDGVNSAGKPLSPAMPRYRLSNQEIDAISAYLQSLPMTPAPGVTDSEIHFATLIGKSLAPETRKALLDVFEAFIEQKNSESRHETKRADHAPWHKAWIYQAYRKWVLHVWEVDENQSTWPEQLERQYQQHPVFALIGGTADGDWRPVHEFCQQKQLPCLFPTTQLPVVAEQDFYSVYLDKGMPIQGEMIAQHIGKVSNPVVQVYAKNDRLGQAAAYALRNRLDGEVKDIVISEDADWRSIIVESDDSTFVLWLDQSTLAGLWKELNPSHRTQRIYLSTTLFGDALASIPDILRNRVYFVHPHELPVKLPQLLLRSNGWLRAKKIYMPSQEQIQADSYLALTLTGMALKRIRGYFNREYFLEGLEHLVDNATFTSRYPRISLAPGQRFVAKGVYIAKVTGDGNTMLEPITDWMIPDTR